jgi:hypothetical protein
VVAVLKVATAVQVVETGITTVEAQAKQHRQATVAALVTVVMVLAVAEDLLTVVVLAVEHLELVNQAVHFLAQLTQEVATAVQVDKVQMVLPILVTVETLQIPVVVQELLLLTIQTFMQMLHLQLAHLHLQIQVVTRLTNSQEAGVSLSNGKLCRTR